MKQNHLADILLMVVREVLERLLASKKLKI